MAKLLMKRSATSYSQHQKCLKSTCSLHCVAETGVCGIGNMHNPIVSPNTGPALDSHERALPLPPD
jgi:hypothetical protein